MPRYWGSGQKQMSLELAELAPGWYDAALVMEPGAVRRRADAGPDPPGDDAPPTPPDPRFRIIATDLPFEGWIELPAILPFLGAGRVKLAVWNHEGDVQQVDRRPSINCWRSWPSWASRPPPAWWICRRSSPPRWLDRERRWPAGADDGLRLLKARSIRGGHSWLTCSRGMPITWIAGNWAPMDRMPLSAGRACAPYRKVYNEFAQLVEKPDLAMPWPAWYEMEGELPATVALAVPPSVLPAQLPLYMGELRQDGSTIFR